MKILQVHLHEIRSFPVNATDVSYSFAFIDAGITLLKIIPTEPSEVKKSLASVSIKGVAFESIACLVHRLSSQKPESHQDFSAKSMKIDGNPS